MVSHVTRKHADSPETYAPLPIPAGKFLANLEEVEKAKKEYEKKL
jgi:hypothetical protein